MVSGLWKGGAGGFACAFLVRLNNLAQSAQQPPDSPFDPRSDPLTGDFAALTYFVPSETRGRTSNRVLEDL